MPVPSSTQRLLAAGVHVFTACGVVCALLAILAALEGAWERSFLWLGVALVIDGVDGTLARLTAV
ncbi:MAG: phosphatidylcholine synthase, partial [Hyphomicrobiaceae bacterium]